MPYREVGDLRSTRIGRTYLEAFVETVLENLAKYIVNRVRSIGPCQAHAS
ncbi:unnamed protein product [Penicillium camemberti]|uniref:Str. FM013 n=1 Tax=Penicillium camemberti (strain FM 013) TaxID=1429867 RepID=A0A0G4PWY2_PENC3|nr:unnamed protein product [Penicillium camemberti]